jgi:GntR family transcriptional regulator/MocR family aminotransferase
MFSEIQIDRNGTAPIYQQIYDFFRNNILTGRIAKNEKLPSKRTLSSTLKVSQNTIDTAYQMLVEDGYAISRCRSGFYAVSNTSEYDFEATHWQAQPEQKYVLTYNDSDSSHIPMKSLSRLYRDFIQNNRDLLYHGDKGGDISLRKAIAKHLFSYRGIKCTADQIILGAGHSYLLGELIKVFDRNTSFALENPCDPWILTTFVNTAKKFELIGTLRTGLTPKEIETLNTNVLYLMPNHHIPTAYQMTLEQKQAAINWINAKDNRYIIEDDYASFTCDLASRKSLYQMNNGKNVILFNSFSYCMAPSIKLSYMVLPEPLVEKWKQKLLYYSVLTSRIEQAIMSEFINRGDFVKLLNKNQNLYSRKRQAIIKKLHSLPFAERLNISGTEAGSHLLVTVNLKQSEHVLYHLALNAGVKIKPISMFSHSPAYRIPEKTFIFGFSNLSLSDIDDAVNLLSSAWNL